MFGPRAFAGRPDAAVDGELRAELRLQPREACELLVVLALELGALLVKAVVRRRAGQRAAGQVFGMEAQAPGHARETQARLGGGSRPAACSVLAKRPTST
jgi:hypothetical protein